MQTQKLPAGGSRELLGILKRSRCCQERSGVREKTKENRAKKMRDIHRMENGTIN